jgi:hypothetical protein
VRPHHLNLYAKGNRALSLKNALKASLAAAPTALASSIRDVVLDLGSAEAYDVILPLVAWVPTGKASTVAT